MPAFGRDRPSDAGPKAGSFLTDGTHLYRVVSCSREAMLLEDCRYPDHPLQPWGVKAVGAKLRVVKEPRK